MTWTGPDVSDNGTCDACGKHVNLDAEPPCPHGYCACDMCEWPAVCTACKLTAEADMATTGTYTPTADPFFDHTAPPPVDRIERDGGYQWGGQWVTVPRKGHTP